MQEYTAGGYQIFTDATADLSDDIMTGLPHVEVIPMRIELDGQDIHTAPVGISRRRSSTRRNARGNSP